MMRITEEKVLQLKCMVAYNKVSHLATYVEEIDVSHCKDINDVLDTVKANLREHGQYILQDEIKNGLYIELFYELVEGD